MKNKLQIIGFLFLTLNFHSQNKSSDFQVNADYTFPKNDAQNPCITSQEYAALNREVNENLKRLRLNKNANRNSLTTSLLWPLKRATGFTQCEYHFIGAYVDQNTVATSIQDYDCGTNTYDGHHGTDIAIWPSFFWIIVPAAAAITSIWLLSILYKLYGQMAMSVP